MFEYALAGNHGRTARPYTFMVSMAVQLFLVALSVVVPLVFADTIPRTQWLAKRLPLFVPPGPAVRSETALPPGAARPAGPRRFPPRLYEPVSLPPRAAIIEDPAEPAWAGAAAWRGAGVPGGLGDPQGALSPPIADALAVPVPATSRPVAVAQPPAAADPPRLLRVGGKVDPPAPLSTPPPVYPLIARQASIQGVVRLEAIIAADGSIRSVTLVDGPALLVQAAMAAVRSWRYTPPRLNGQPVEILMNVEVKFQLCR